jgi:ATP:ADP antiporter, AAA family
MELDFKKNKQTIILFICFLLIMATFTLMKELRDFVFVLTVGKKFIPEIKNLTYMLMIPMVSIYAFAASTLNKNKLLITYSLLYGIIGLFLSYFITHSSIGLHNETTSHNRIFGWVFYIFVEGIKPFVVSVLWSFFNSISNPSDVKNQYISMTIATKIGGVLASTAAFAMASFGASFAISYINLCFWISILSSIFMLLITVAIAYFSYSVEENETQGYADKIENKNKSEEGNIKFSSGLKTFFKYPYALGILGMTFFWEIINVIFNYMKIGVGLDNTECRMEFLSFLYENSFWSNAAGLAVAIFGTTYIIKRFGERVSIILVPIFIGIGIFVFLFSKATGTVIFVYAALKAINDSFACPVREALYIPTTREIRFQTKTWIDSFGAKLAKALAGVYIKTTQFVPIQFLQLTQVSFFSSIIFVWTIMAYCLGKKWQSTIRNKELIGASTK